MRARLLQVLWLHGGGFIMGSSSNPSVSPPPDLFVSEAQVIFVSVNYRQGPFGFLSSSAMPDFGGMLGIGDQVSRLDVQVAATNGLHATERGGQQRSKITVAGDGHSDMPVRATATMVRTRCLADQRYALDPALHRVLWRRQEQGHRHGRKRWRHLHLQ